MGVGLETAHIGDLSRTQQTPHKRPVCGESVHFEPSSLRAGVLL